MVLAGTVPDRPLQARPHLACLRSPHRRPLTLPGNKLRCPSVPYTEILPLSTRDFSNIWELFLQKQTSVSVGSILQKGSLRSRETVSGKRLQGPQEPEISTERFQDAVEAWPLAVPLASPEHMTRWVQKYASGGRTVCRGEPCPPDAQMPRAPRAHALGDSLSFHWRITLVFGVKSGMFLNV